MSMFNITLKQPLVTGISLLFSLLLLCGCGSGDADSADTTDTSAAVQAEDSDDAMFSHTVEYYLDLGMPGPDSLWSSEDYARAAEVMEQVAAKSHRHLPRIDGDAAPLLKRMIDRQNLRNILDDPTLSNEAKFVEIEAVTEGVVKIFSIYLNGIQQNVNFDMEMAEFQGFMLELAQMAMQFTDRILAEASPEALKSDDVVLGQRQMSLGSAQMVGGVMRGMADTSYYGVPSREKLAGYLGQFMPFFYPRFDSAMQSSLRSRLDNLTENEQAKSVKQELVRLQHRIDQLEQ